MPSRRAFLTGAAAMGVAPGVTWADAGSPSYLSAARLSDASYRLFALDADVQPMFSVPLPDRGHAAVAHPYRPEAVAFARRPGTFALVLDCAERAVTATLTAQEGRHFYGHGVFSRDGKRLFTTENDYERGAGRIGIWAADQGYRRIGEIASGGIGPHDIRRLPATGILVVANGGIDTHPETGREKLNIPTMQPNLSYLAMDGTILGQIELPAEMRLNSIRHLAVRRDGLVAFGCQWQGDLSHVPPLLGLHRLDGPITLLSTSAGDCCAIEGYVGSVAFSRDGSSVGLTGPRGSKVLTFDVAHATIERMITAQDVCGIAAGPGGYAVTTGTGSSGLLGRGLQEHRRQLSWDNHLVALDQGLGET